MTIYYPRATVAIQYMDEFELITPRSVSIECNSYKEPDKVSIQIDRGIDIDPRLARRAAVAVAITNRKSNLVSDEFNKLIHQENSYDFFGWVDSADVSLNENKIINLKARDHTALLIDNHWKGDELNLKHPLKVLLEMVLTSNEATKHLKLSMKNANCILGDNRAVGNKYFAAEANSSLWDVINSLVAEAGVIAWVDRDTLYVEKAQSTPGTGPVFTYHKNIKSLSMRQSNQSSKTRGVTIASYDPDSKKTIAATYPIKEEKENNEDNNTEDSQDSKKSGTPDPGKPFYYTVSGVTSLEALKKMAQDVYERRSAQDIRLSLETREMTPDILALRAGSPVTIVGGFDPNPTRYQVIKATHSVTDQGYKAKLELANYITITPVNTNEEQK